MMEVCKHGMKKQWVCGMCVGELEAERDALREEVERLNTEVEMLEECCNSCDRLEIEEEERDKAVDLLTEAFEGHHNSVDLAAWREKTRIFLDGLKKGERMMANLRGRYQRTGGFLVCPKCGERHSARKMKYHVKKCKKCKIKLEDN